MLVTMWQGSSEAYEFRNDRICQRKSKNARLPADGTLRHFEYSRNPRPAEVSSGTRNDHRYKQPALGGQWLLDALNGDERIGFPWQPLNGLLRISTQPRMGGSPPAGAHAFNNFRRLTQKSSRTANIVSADTDFARLTKARWINPIT